MLVQIYDLTITIFKKYDHSFTWALKVPLLQYCQVIFLSTNRPLSIISIILQPLSIKHSSLGSSLILSKCKQNNLVNWTILMISCGNSWKGKVGIHTFLGMVSVVYNVTDKVDFGNGFWFKLNQNKCRLASLNSWGTLPWGSPIRRREELNGRRMKTWKIVTEKKLFVERKKFRCSYLNTVYQFYQ